MSIKNKSSPCVYSERTRRENILEESAFSPFYLSACAFHNSRLNFVPHLGNKIIANIMKEGEIVGYLCGKINLKRAESDRGRVNQRVQHYEIFLKKTSAGVEKLSFSLGLALIFFLILVIFPSVTVLMSVPFGIYCRISLLPFSMAPFCHAQ